MLKDIIKQWNENNVKLEEYFKTTDQKEYSNSYLDIVKKIFELVLIEKQYQLKRITVIDDGDYQGTQIFFIPEETYQPNAGDYIITHTYYGSCSGCDTLKGINSYEDGLPTDEQVEDYMVLALHLVQRMTRIYDDDSNE
jgi:hypothetical protein